MPGGFSQFFENLQRLESIRLAREQQKLAERNSGAAQLNTFSNIIQALSPEARDSFTQAYSQATGLSPELLGQVALKQVASLPVQVAQKTAAGAAQVPDAAVASAQMTGALPGTVGVQQQMAQGAAQITPQEAHAGALEALTRQTPGQFAIDTQIAGLPPDVQRAIAEISGGTAISAPQQAQLGLTAQGQQLNYDINRRQLDLTKTLNESRDAIDLQNIAARLEAGRGQGAMDITDLNAALKLETGIMNDIQSGKWSQTAQVNGVTAIYQSMVARGIPKDVAAEISGLNRIKQGKRIDPAFYERILGTSNITEK